jgi:outer membrane receptor protein involved in Fe transport
LSRCLILATDWRWESDRRTLAVDANNRPIMARSGTVGNLRLTARASSTRRELLGRAQVAISVRNLLDARYEYPGGLEHLQPAIEQDGRTWGVGLGYVF